MEKAPAHILVIKLGALGDFIQALGPMAAIRNHHKDARITLLTTAPFADIARRSGYFDDVWVDVRPKWHDIRGWIDLRARLNGGGFSRVYDLQNNDRTAFYLKLCSPAPEWVGAAPGASHRNASKDRVKGKAWDGHVQTLALAGIENIRVDDLSWMKTDKNWDSIPRPYVLIVPGSAVNHPKKRWPAEHYAALCKKLFERGYHPVLLGGESERDVIGRITRRLPQAIDLSGGTSLLDLPALARAAAGAIGNDTGPMHLIAPAGCHCVILFSKNTKPHKHAPIGAHVVTLQKDSLDTLSVEEVWAAFLNQQTPVAP